MSAQSSLPDLSFWQALAARRYAKVFEKSKRDHHCRIGAMDDLKAARAVLTPHQAAAMDMIAGRGRSIEDLAKATGRTPADLSALFLSATTELARHYEAQARHAA